MGLKNNDLAVFRPTLLECLERGFNLSRMMTIVIDQQDPAIPDLSMDLSQIVDPETGEDCTYHGVEIPVTLPGLQDLTFGGWYSGSPFLGAAGTLPPGEGGLNPNGGFSYMWPDPTMA